MIDFFYDRTPNARKVLLFLEEVGLPYRIRWIDITAGDQFTDDFRRVNPNAKIPAIIDTGGPGGRPIRVFESGAILWYLAEKTGELLAADPHLRCETLQWVFWQMANQGPMLGQATHFFTHARRRGIDDEYAIGRYVGEAKRLYAVLDGQLEGREWIVGDDYSIADIACWPWVRPFKGQGVDLAEYPNVTRWSSAIAARPAAAVKPAEDAAGPQKGEYSDEQWRTLFGAPATKGPT